MLDQAPNFGAGVGDTLTFGLTYLGRQGINYALDTPDLIDYDGTAYYAGEWAGTAVDFVLGGGPAAVKSLGKAGLKQGSKILSKTLAKNNGDDIAKVVGRETAEQTGKLADVVSGATGCFTEDTQVWVEENLALSASQVLSGRQPEDGTSALTSVAQETLVSINQVGLGQRVLSRNPSDDPYDFAFGRVNSTWRQIDLRVLHDDGSVVEVSALRPQSWIDSQDLSVGLEIDLSLPERPDLCRAIVTNIGPCPPIYQGEGELVIATYRTVHRVPILNVLLAGGESIRGTIDHRIWSHRDQQWKQLEELESGETVQTRFGPLPVVSSRLEKARQRVYNLEVQGQHVYEISRSGVLVHNNGDAHEEIIRQLAKNGKKNADEAVEKVTGSHSKKLADDLVENAGPRPPGFQAAHIVPTNNFTKRAADVQKAIKTAQNKFDKFLSPELRDKTINGFWAEAGHAGTHTDKFFRELGKAFRGVNSEASAKRALDNLWKRIARGEFQ